MDFKEALINTINRFGREIVFDRRFLSILADYGAFKNNPAYKFILKEALVDQISYRKILESTGNERARYISQLSLRKGFDNSIVNTLFDVIFKQIHGNSGQNIDIAAQQIKLPITSSEFLDFPEITFLGLPQGSTIKEFEARVKKQGGAIICKSQTFEILRMQESMSFNNIELCCKFYPETKIVFQIEIDIHFSPKLRRTKILTILEEIYRNKYGNPQFLKGVYKWTVKDSFINLFIPPKKGLHILIIYDFNHELWRIETEAVEAKRKAKELSIRKENQMILDEIKLKSNSNNI